MGLRGANDDGLNLPAKRDFGVVRRGRALSPSDFWKLADVPPDAEWFANIQNKNTRRAYRNDVEEFISFAGIKQPEGLRTVTRAHVIAWRKSLEARELEPATIRRKLAALSSLYESLSEANAVYVNPVDGVERPKADANEGKTPALGDAQLRALLGAAGGARRIESEEHTRPTRSEAPADSWQGQQNSFRAIAPGRIRAHQRISGNGR